MSLRVHRRGLALAGFFLAGILTAVAEEWQPLKDPHFTILVPAGKIERNEETKKDKEGKVQSMMRIYVVTKGEGIFLAGVTEYYAPIETEQELELDCANFAKAVNGRVTAKQRITHDGCPALRFVALTENKVSFASLVVMEPGNVVVQAVASYTGGTEPAAVTDFLHSLRPVLP
jgi:hypothetical protein